MLLFTISLLLCCVVLPNMAQDTCTNFTQIGIESNCANVTCANWYDYENYIISFLDDRSGPGADQFSENMKQATEIAASFGLVFPESFLEITHMSLLYLCCYSFDDYLHIANVLHNYLEWEPFNLTFSHAGCTVSSDYSLIVWADNETQSEMSQFVQSIENTLIAHNITIHKPRSLQEPFHSTLGTVLSDYPLDDAVQAINKAIPYINSIPMTIDSFTMLLPPEAEFYSSSGQQVSQKVVFKANRSRK